MSQYLSSATVVIGALRVKITFEEKQPSVGNTYFNPCPAETLGTQCLEEMVYM